VTAPPAVSAGADGEVTVVNERLHQIADIPFRDAEHGCDTDLRRIGVAFIACPQLRDDIGDTKATGWQVAVEHHLVEPQDFAGTLFRLWFAAALRLIQGAIGTLIGTAIWRRLGLLRLELDRIDRGRQRFR
jgi:hypothetical protein